MFQINKRKIVSLCKTYMFTLPIALTVLTLLPCTADDFLTPMGLYSFVDYLLWKPQEDGLSYGLVKRGDAIVELQEPVLRRASGVRLGLGFNGCEAWDIKGIWTHLRSCAATECVSDMPEGFVITPLTTLNDPIIRAGTGLASKLNFAYDTADVNVGRGWNRWGTFVVNAQVGAKWARIHQTHNVLYTGLDNSGTQAKISRINNFSGAGPTLNVQIMWPIGCDFSLYSEAAEAFLAGKTCTVMAAGMDNDGLTAPPGIAQKRSTVRFMSRFLVGIGWGRSAWRDVCDVYLRAGYEMQWWPQQWNLCSSLAQAQAGGKQMGDLALQGLVLTAGIYF